MSNKNLKSLSVSVSIHQADVVQQITHTHSRSAVVRFPSFPSRFNSRYSSVHDYENDYENHCQFFAPSFEILKAGVENYREFEKITPGDVVFWNELLCAPDEVIYFVDLYFDEKNLNRLSWICDCFSKQSGRKNTHIIVLTCCGDEYKRLSAEYNEGREQIKYWANVDMAVYEIKDRDLLHDRFVLLGGNFWHFGASAGGMHAGLNAYSGPWPDTNSCLARLLGILTNEENSYKRLSVDSL